MATLVTVHDEERAADFQRVLGTATVRVKGWPTFPARLPGFDEPQPVFELDLDWVEEIGRTERLVRHLAARFNVPASEVERDLRTVGVPILATDCTWTFPLTTLV